MEQGWRGVLMSVATGMVVCMCIHVLASVFASCSGLDSSYWAWASCFQAQELLESPKRLETNVTNQACCKCRVSGMGGSWPRHSLIARFAGLRLSYLAGFQASAEAQTWYPELRHELQPSPRCTLFDRLKCMPFSYTAIKIQFLPVSLCLTCTNCHSRFKPL